MGIPSFFRTLLQKNKSIIRGAVKTGTVDYFFIDYNSLIYNAWYRIHRKISVQNEEHIHTALIQETIRMTVHMVRDIVSPKKYVYISLDGCAPRAKMVQQRSRRYKSVYYKELVKKKTAELGMEPTVEWDPSPNICPGTVFMSKLSTALRDSMQKGEFKDIQVILSDSNIPGEGEHKFLKRIRKLFADEKTRDEELVIYSPDGDMISLALLTHKNNINIMRIPDEKSPLESRFARDYEFIYCDLNILRTDFIELMSKTYNDPNLDAIRLLTDYNFLLFMVGNDFVVSLPFLKIRHGGLDLLIRLYNEIRPQVKDYLVDYHPVTRKIPILNLTFFEKLCLRLAQMESSEMNRHLNNMRKEGEGLTNKKRFMEEEEMNPLQIFESRFQHLSYFHRDHPEYEKHVHLLSKIDYSRPKHEWKAQYYTHFLQIDPSNQRQYNTERTRMVVKYLESLMFTLQYYLTGCPSYHWHYPFMVPPIPSDIHTVLTKQNFNMNGIVFDQAKPYTPFQQLMMILPPQMSFLVPKPLASLMIDPREGCLRFYPKSFELDSLAGFKYIYSEAILPEFEDSILLAKIVQKETMLEDKEQQRNKINSSLTYIKELPLDS